MWHEKSVRKISATIGLMPGACFVRKYLQETVRSSFPNVVVNSSTWLESRGNILFVDGAWIPPLDFQFDHESSHVGICSGKPVYYFCKRNKLTSLTEIQCNLDLVERLRSLDLPEITVEGNLLQYLWDFVGNNGAQIIGDLKGCTNFQTLMNLLLVYLVH